MYRSCSYKLGCAATAGGCILLGNDLGSDINDMLHPDKAGSYNSIRGTIETGIKLTGLPKEYQGLATDVAYFGVSSKLASTGKWENVSNTLNNIKIPGLGGSKEVVVTDSLGNTYKVKPESVVDDLANNKVLEASKNKGGNLGSSNNNINNTLKPKDVNLSDFTQKGGKIDNFAEGIKGKNYNELEKLFDEELVGKLGYKKAPMKTGEGVKYQLPNGKSIMLEKGFENFEDITHRGPYIKLSGYKNSSLSDEKGIIRVPLEGNPALK